MAKDLKILDFVLELERQRDLEFKTLDLKEGDIVLHPRFGKGQVLQINMAKKVNNIHIDIRFENGGTKRVLFIFAELKKLK